MKTKKTEAHKLVQFSKVIMEFIFHPVVIVITNVMKT